jgi:hypothetical protein
MPASANHAQHLALTRGVKTALGGPLLPAFGDDAGGVRFELARNLHHLRGGCHFQVQRLANPIFQPGHVRIEDVAAVFAQMRGDAIGAGSDCDFGSLDWIGMPAAACVAHGGDVIDVHA